MRHKRAPARPAIRRGSIIEQTSIQIENGPIDLDPGMAVTAEIKTGRRRVISYLLSPLVRYGQEGMRER